MNLEELRSILASGPPPPCPSEEAVQRRIAFQGRTISVGIEEQRCGWTTVAFEFVEGKTVVRDHSWWPRDGAHGTVEEVLEALEDRLASPLKIVGIDHAHDLPDPPWRVGASVERKDWSLLIIDDVIPEDRLESAAAVYGISASHFRRVVEGLKGVTKPVREAFESVGAALKRLADSFIKKVGKPPAARPRSAFSAPVRFSSLSLESSSRFALCVRRWRRPFPRAPPFAAADYMAAFFICVRCKKVLACGSNGRYDRIGWPRLICRCRGWDGSASSRVQVRKQLFQPKPKKFLPMEAFRL